MTDDFPLTGKEEYQPLISVIVPVYNVERWLDKCLASICTQTYRNLQIICVDDGSTDASPKILADWAAKDDRICVITKQNGGLSSARNAGLQVCTGEFVTGVDSDDWLLPDIYEKVVPHLTADCDMLVYMAQSVDEDGELYRNGQKYHFALPKQGLYDGSWLQENRLNPCFWNKFWRRSIIEKHELTFPDGLVFEDEVFIRMYTPYVRNFYSLPEIGYMYVQREGSIMHSRYSVIERAKINLAAAELMCTYNETHDVPLVAWENLLDFMGYGIPLKKGVAENRKTAYALRCMYGAFVEKHHLKELFPHDYRLKYVVSAMYGWQRWFASRSLSHCTYKVAGIPLVKIEYKNGKIRAWRTIVSYVCQWIYCVWKKG